MISACSFETLGWSSWTSTDLPRPIVVTSARSLMIAPVVSIRMWGVSITVLRHVRPATEVSPQRYPVAAKSMQSAGQYEHQDGKSGTAIPRKYTAEATLGEEGTWRTRRRAGWQTWSRPLLR